MNNKSNLPDIRFKGFEEDWKNSLLENIINIERGASPRPIDKFLTKSFSGYNWIKISDAPSNGIYIDKTSEKIIKEGLSFTRIVNKGDLILSNSMSYGRPYIVNLTGCIHDGWLSIKDYNKYLNTLFFCYFLGSENMINKYKSLAAGSTVNNLNKELVLNCNIDYPNLSEQTKIGELFKNLDDLITLTEKKYNYFKNIKETLLSKMLPANYSNIPEIRFKGFTESFDSNIMGNLLKYEQPGEYIVKNDEYNDGNAGVPVLTAGQSFVLGYTLEKFGIKDSSKNNPIIIFDDFITSSHYIDFPFKVKSSAIKILSTINKESHLYYLYMILKQQQYSVVNHERHWISKSSKFNILVPKSAPEQNKIGELFKNLDQLITLTKQKHEKLKNIKNGLLAKMFC